MNKHQKNEPFAQMYRRGAEKEEIKKRFCLTEDQYNRSLAHINRIQAEREARAKETEADRIKKEWNISKQKGEAMIHEGSLSWDAHAEIMRSFEDRLRALGVEL